MTYYYFIGADVPLKPWEDNRNAIEIWPSEDEEGYFAKALHYPLQYEIYNGLDSESEAISLMNYLRFQAEDKKQCVFEIAHLLSSNIEDYQVKERIDKIFSEIQSPKELIIPVGTILTIRKNK